MENRTRAGKPLVKNTIRGKNPWIGGGPLVEESVGIGLVGGTLSATVLAGAGIYIFGSLPNAHLNISKNKCSIYTTPATDPPYPPSTYLNVVTVIIIVKRTTANARKSSQSRLSSMQETHSGSPQSRQHPHPSGPHSCSMISLVCSTLDEANGYPPMAVLT